MDPFLPNYVVMDARLVASFRKALVAWNPCEFGAPAIHPSTPLAIPEIEGTSGGAALDVFVSFGTLECGPRSFPNELRRAGPFSRWSHGIPDGWLDRDAVEIDVTEDHLRLLRMLQIDDRAPNLAPGFDPKRPVECTDVVRDVWELFHGRDAAEAEGEEEGADEAEGAERSPHGAASPAGAIDQADQVDEGDGDPGPSPGDGLRDFGPEPFDFGDLEPEIDDASFGRWDDEDDEGTATGRGGREPTQEELDHCRRLYMDMPAVLQVFLREATIRPGIYGGIPILNMWKWMEDLPDWLEPERAPGS